MRLRCWISWCLAPGLVFAGESPRLVKSVAVPGTTLAVNLATQVGQPYDVAKIAKDVHYLWSLGRFDDIRVEASRDPDGTAIVFRATTAEWMMLHEIRIEPSTSGIQLKAPEGSRIGRLEAERIAQRARNQLVEGGYPDARVTYEFTPCGNKVDLKLTVNRGRVVAVKQVEFKGELALDASELRGALKELRSRRLLPAIPHMWGGWQL
jgi:outer membrane protein assembly factor BamA